MSKQALLGKVMNLGKSDIIQSVTPGDADAVIDCRGISSYIKTKRVDYTWTQANHDNGFATIPITWDTPFPDVNYTCVFTPQDTSEPPNNIGAWDGDMHSLTAAGFDAVIYEFSTSFPLTVGTTFTIHAIAIHD